MANGLEQIADILKRLNDELKLDIKAINNFCLSVSTLLNKTCAGKTANQL